MRTRRRLGLDESHDDQGSSSRNSGNIGGPSIRCPRRNCLAAAAEPSGSSPAPTSRSGWRWKRRSCTWSKRCGTPTAVPHCHDGSQMLTTQRPPQAVEKSPFGPSILAWLVTWKFLHHLPVYRQQELLLGPLKRWLSRALLCGLLGRTALALRPLERLIRQRVLASAVINADETEVRMLKPGHGKAITGYLSGYAGDADHPFVFYDFRPSRSRDGPAEMLADYRGYLADRWLRGLHLAGAPFGGPAGGCRMLGSRSKGLRGSDSGDQPPAGPRGHDLDAAALRHRGPCAGDVGGRIAGRCARPRRCRSWRG